jgi:hypothetical protein
MAIQGINFELTEGVKKFAIQYVEESGLFKNRLADFLSISRPTLNKVLNEDEAFFTSLKRADAIFCKKLIEGVGKKNPFLILRTKYREEFNDTLKVGFDPEEEIQKVKRILETTTTKEIMH